MKMLVITSIKEDLQKITDIMEKAAIPVFSVSETIGHKSAHNNYLLENWFGGSNEQVDALFFFSFTENEKATAAMQLIIDMNKTIETRFPARAFILPVETSSY